ncbi:hypothetical protein F8M41_025827 [Gigaspora margarita]|uniref:Uncharacterized protein n=1 Tax=Gigaspora margarita TaxID=4874 RepID=A0A8H4ABG6_GIGMA|nr:hypothetical protein F8M41_025827 [Gigaspora margarita]
MALNKSRKINIIQSLFIIDFNNSLTTSIIITSTTMTPTITTPTTMTLTITTPIMIIPIITTPTMTTNCLR